MRDKKFEFNGECIVVDTAVLPTIRIIKGNGQMCEGVGLNYLAGKLKLIERDQLELFPRLWEAWNKFCEDDACKLFSPLRKMDGSYTDHCQDCGQTEEEH